MNLKKVSLIIAAIIILTIILVACSKSDATSVPVENQGTTQESSASSTQETVPTTSQASSAPEDVPIMPEAYEVQVSNQLNVSYKVKSTIQDVVTFYQQEFVNYGWDVVNNPDTVIGSMAQLSRSNAAGDRLTFSLQYNPVGEFTIVTIYVTRVP
jgi:hypothetical protein